VDEERNFIYIRPLDAAESSMLVIPTSCHFLQTSYHRVGPLQPLSFLEIAWETLNIIFENFPSHVSLYQDGLPEDCLISQSEQLRRQVSLAKSRMEQDVRV